MSFKFNKMNRQEFQRFLKIYIENSGISIKSSIQLQIREVYNYLRTGKKIYPDMNFFTKEQLKSLFKDDNFMIHLMIECEFRYSRITEDEQFKQECEAGLHK